jgi:hypothetical protein
VIREIAERHAGSINHGRDRPPGWHASPLRTISQWVAIAVCAILGVALFALVDLTPAVEGDFFFSTDDPQLQGSRLVEQQFGSAPQIFIAARSDRLFSRQYLQRIRGLTADLSRVDGVVDVRSLTQGPEELENIDESPFWSRLLLAPDRSASFVVLRIGNDDHARTVSDIDRILERHSADGSSSAPRVCRTSLNTFADN